MGVEGGGWGWLVVFASFMIHFISEGVIITLSMFVPFFIEEFHCGRAVAGGVGALALGLAAAAGPISSAIVNRFGHRNTATAGSLLAAIGVLISSFSPSIFLMYFSYGIMTSIGTSMSNLPSIVILSEYFDRRLSMVTGISYCGVGLGMMLMGTLTGYLIDIYGWRGAMLIQSAIVLNNCVCGMLFVSPATKVFEKSTEKQIELLEMSIVPASADTKQPDGSTSDDVACSSTTTTGGSVCAPDEEHDAGKVAVKNGNDQQRVTFKVFDFSLLTNPALLDISLSYIALCCGISGVVIFLPDVGRCLLGLDLGQISVMFLVLGVSNTVLYIVAGAILALPWVNSIVLHFFTTVLLGIVTCFVTYINSFTLMCLYSVLLGGCLAIPTCLLPLALIDLVGVDRLTDSFGIVLFSSGVGTVIGSPIAGALFDHRQNYNDSYMFSGLSLVASGLIAIPLYLRSRCRQRPADISKIANNKA